MSILVDTNVLLRAAQLGHPHNQAAVNAVARLRQAEESLCLFPQNIYEFWVTGTRPIDVNGLAWTVSQAEAEVTKLKSIYLFHEDVPAIFPAWERLVVKYQIVGKSAHDARLVAAMMVHKLSKILSFNHRDFQRYPEITAINPEAVVAAQVP